MGNLNSVIGLDDTEEVLFEQLFVETLEVLADNIILVDLGLVFVDCLSVLTERLVFACLGDVSHGIKLDSLVLESLLSTEELVDLIILVGHDSGEDHVHECLESPGVIDLVQCLIGFEKVSVADGWDREIFDRSIII